MSNLRNLVSSYIIYYQMDPLTRCRQQSNLKPTDWNSKHTQMILKPFQSESIFNYFRVNSPSRNEIFDNNKKADEKRKAVECVKRNFVFFFVFLVLQQTLRCFSPFFYFGCLNTHIYHLSDLKPTGSALWTETKLTREPFLFFVSTFFSSYICITNERRFGLRGRNY